ncbi:MAG: NAD/NADP octopine/nopaline dehydrogenase family protein [Pseudomonadota bacterium]
MKVAIIGTGGVALATAALLDRKGVSASLVSLSGQGGEALKSGQITATGAIEATVAVELAASAGSALQDASHVIVATSADRYASVLEGILPHLDDRHKILISGELSQFSAVLETELRARGKAPSIVGLASTLVTGRRKEGATVQVGLIRKSLLAYSKTPSGAPGSVAEWNEIVGGPLSETDSAARILLANLNPIVHAANALCNYTRIEKGEAWSNYGGITSGVAHLLQALDAERLELGRALGLDLASYTENFSRANGFDADMPLHEMALGLHEKRGGLPKGPTDPSTRYITEDVPFGLVVLEALGAQQGIATPITTSFISIFSAIYGRNFREENPFLSQLDVGSGS